MIKLFSIIFYKKYKLYNILYKYLMGNICYKLNCREANCGEANSGDVPPFKDVSPPVCILKDKRPIAPIRILSKSPTRFHTRSFINF